MTGVGRRGCQAFFTTTQQYFVQLVVADKSLTSFVVRNPPLEYQTLRVISQNVPLIFFIKLQKQ